MLTQAFIIVSLFCVVYSDTFIPASDPSIWTVGRTRVETNGSLSFDWELTQFYINIQGNYVNIHIQAFGSVHGRFIAQIDGFEQTSFWVAGTSTPGEVQVIKIASELGGARQIRVISVLEPFFQTAAVGNYFTFVGFSTDGSARPAGPARTRKIELVGDSISAGFGARGYQGAPDGCPVNTWTSGNPYTYGYFIAESFQANYVPIAWSGKGMYQNCCDNGETMPSYFLQTLGGGDYTKDWDFSKYVPDMLLINLGTNDFGHDSGPQWEANFISTYVDFVLNTTVVYYKTPAMPVFVAQGPMNCGTNLKNCLNTVVQQINAKNGNAVYLNLCGPPNDGCGGHPGVLGHQQMYEMAVPVISQKMKW